MFTIGQALSTSDNDQVKATREDYVNLKPVQPVSVCLFGYVFIDSEYHKIYFTDYFFTFYGQRITQFWFVYVWCKSFFEISFS